MALLNLLKLMMLSLLRPVPQKKKKKKRNLLTPDIIEYKCIAKFEVSLLYKFILGYTVIALEIQQKLWRSLLHCSHAFYLQLGKVQRQVKTSRANQDVVAPFLGVAELDLPFKAQKTRLIFGLKIVLLSHTVTHEHQIVSNKFLK